MKNLIPMFFYYSIIPIYLLKITFECVSKKFSGVILYRVSYMQLAGVTKQVITNKVKKTTKLKVEKGKVNTISKLV